MSFATAVADYSQRDYEIAWSIDGKLATDDTLAMVQALTTQHAGVAPADGRVTGFVWQSGNRLRDGVALVCLDDV